MKVQPVVQASPADDQRQALLKQAALSEALLDSMDVGIVACDENGRLTLFNKLSAAFHGIDADDTVEPAELAGQVNLYRPNTEQLLTVDEVPILRALRGEPVEDVEVVIAPQGRPRRLVSVTGRQIIGLDGTVLGAVIGIRDVTSQRAVEAVLSDRGAHDPLTGLPNRVLLDERTTLTLAGAAGEPRSTALLFVDLDGFKAVNDSHGHACGDQVLRQVARRLDDMVRATDTAARLGGDEFVVMCPGMPIGDPVHAQVLAGRIIEELGRPFHVGESTVHLSATIGIASCDGNELDAEELVARADTAMLTAKRNGTARVATYADESTASVRQASRSSAQIELLLRHALDHDTLQVHYQPVVNLRTGRVVSTEALARLTDEDGTMVPPTTFIPVAERYGLVGRVGESVLRQALAQTVQWRREVPGCGRLGVSVNLSVKQLSDARLVDKVRTALTESGLPASGLTLELTESVFSDSDEHTDQLSKLRRLGLKLSIDDFGTGYSSLSYLRRFTVDTIKIDRSFVADLVDERNRRVTHSIVRMALELGVPIVAEGIETTEQLAVLRSLGCRLGQGYLLARPAPPEATAEKLRTPRPRSR